MGSMFIPLAGPIEFTAVDVLIILGTLAAIWVVLPSAAGAVAVYLYRRRVPPEQRSFGAAFARFAVGFALALVGVQVLAWLSNGWSCLGFTGTVGC
jgi:hypothetical protein